jgi:hypothetical protein
VHAHDAAGEQQRRVRRRHLVRLERGAEVSSHLGRTQAQM